MIKQRGRFLTQSHLEDRMYTIYNVVNEETGSGIVLTP